MTDVYERTIAQLGLEARPEQAELVRQLRAVATDPDPAHKIVQAGTGVGKTLAVLTVGAEAGQPGAPALVLIVTNGLARQYVGRDADAVHATTGAMITRVIGARYYLCASGSAGHDTGLPQDATDDEWENSELAKIRDEWLEDQAADAPWATRWERQDHHGPGYACPGWPSCDGRWIGGCGKRKARGRGLTDAHVVVTNYHLATIQTRLPMLELLPHPVLTIVDEAHALPDTICDILSAEIGPGFGRLELDRGDGEDRDRAGSMLFDYVHRLRTATLDQVAWRDDPWHTEHRVKLLSSQRATEVARALDTYDGVEDAPISDEGVEAAPKVDAEKLEARAADGLDTVATLRTLIASATDLSIVAVVHRPPDDPAEPVAEGARPDTLYLRRADVGPFIASMLGDHAALVSGTIPTTLPARCGLPDVEPVDVGHPFDYATQVRGYLSRHDGTKSVGRSHSRAQRDQLFDLRVVELARFLIGDGAPFGGLVLAPAHADVTRLTRALPALLGRHVTVYAQPRHGGSEAAMREVTRYRIDRQAGLSAVLIGVDSLATGLDLPGDLLTRVAWWTLPLGRASTVDEQRQRMHPGRGAAPARGVPSSGSYLDDRLRVKVTQGVGRLIRSRDDTGEVLLCDRRFRDHMLGSTTILDAHLRQIPWAWAPRLEEEVIVNA